MPGNASIESDPTPFAQGAGFEPDEKRIDRHRRGDSWRGVGGASAPPPACGGQPRRACRGRLPLLPVWRAPIENRRQGDTLCAYAPLACSCCYHRPGGVRPVVMNAAVGAETGRPASG
jgi:hypothetical protein